MIRSTCFVLALVAALILSGCVEDEHWNQKLTLIVQTPNGEITGSVVQRIDWEGVSGLYAEATKSNEGAKTKMSVTGEALALEIAPGRWLFALLKGDQGWKGEPGTNFGYAVGVPKGHFARSQEAVGDILALPKDTPVTLPREAWPMLVTFDEVAKPETVRRVDPNDVAATFGSGVELKGVTLEVTVMPVTEGRIEGLLSWLPSIGGGMLDGAAISSIEAANRLANDLTRLDIVRP